MWRGKEGEEREGRWGEGRKVRRGKEGGGRELRIEERSVVISCRLSHCNVAVTISRIAYLTMTSVLRIYNLC